MLLVPPAHVTASVSTPLAATNVDPARTQFQGVVVACGDRRAAGAIRSGAARHVEELIAAKGKHLLDASEDDLTQGGDGSAAVHGAGVET